MKHFMEHLRVYIFRGLMAIIPLLLCFWAVQLLYVLIDKKVVGFLNNFLAVGQIPGLGIILVLVILYILGLIVSNIIGRQLFKGIDGITQRIPLIKVIYDVGKQLSHGLSLADENKQAFQKAVLIKVNDNGLLAVGFIMNTMLDRKNNDEYVFVLMPTSPTPASGFVIAVKPSQIIDPGWTVEECLKLLVSIGIIAPKEMQAQKVVPPQNQS